MTNDEFDLWLNDPNRRSLVMGVLNVTPDSFSDGGRYAEPAAAIAQARAMAAAGADLIDIGGESTRPGSMPVPESEQIRRIAPVIRAIAAELPVVISIDTTRAAVASAALDEGGKIINDISAGLDDPDMLPLAASRAVPIILMHMLGRPATMQDNPQYADIVAEVSRFLLDRRAAAIACGVDRRQVLLDPGIGFGKTVEHNLALLRDTRRLAELGQALVIGASRKRFIGAITGESQPSERVFGTAGAIAWVVANGADIVRVHDVEPMIKVVRMTQAIAAGKVPQA